MKNSIIKFTVLASLSTCVLILAKVLESNAETREAKVVEVKSEVMDLEAALALKEKQRAMTQRVIDFMLDSPRFAVIEADRSGVILSARGDLDVVGWTREGLEGGQVSDLIELYARDDHAKAYRSRVARGRTGGVHLFENELGLSERGERVALRGLVLWHHERGIAVAFIAPE